jgi:5-methylthioadenosine/S-adenosylhomocysteine deaminase
MAVIENALFEAGISGEGMHGYPRGAIFVPQTAHYSFKKIIEALGLGRKSLVYVDVDEDFKMSMEDLKARLEREDRKIIAVVPIVGTTEQGAVDPVDKIVEMRDKLAKEVGQSFFIHADAAYGGYAKTVSKDKLAAYVYNSLQAIEHCDSVTIDPHKLGYVPYPTGAILFKDKGSRNFVICDAPYVFHGEPEVIGQYILEGSKPGAAAVACWLAHRSVPLNESGYGRIIGTTIDIIRNLEIRFETDLKDDVQVLVRPHLNMLCFRVNFKGVPCNKMNEINGRVYRYFLEGPDKDYPITSRRYFISETRLKIGEYKFLRKKLGLPEETRKEEEVNIDLLLRNGYIITMDSERVILANASVAISGPEIVDIGDSNELDGKYTAKEVIDCTGKVIMPGLINLHTHAPMTLFRGYANDLPLEKWLQRYMFPLEKQFVNEEFCYYGALLACIEMIECGTTCFADMYYYEDEVAKAAKEAGMRGVLAESVLKNETPDSADFEEGLSLAEEYIKRWRDDRLIIPAVGPHAPYTCNDEILIRCKELADRYKVPLLIHVAETIKEVKDSMNSTGHRPVEYLGALGVLDRNVVAAHCVWLTSKEMEMLRENGMKVAHNPTSNLKLGSGIAPVPELQDIGVVTGIGTDGCASNNDLDMIEEMRLASLLHKGTHADPTKVDAMRVIAMATIEGAKALGIDDITGSIEISKRADIAILNLDRTPDDRERGGDGEMQEYS